MAFIFPTRTAGLVASFIAPSAEDLARIQYLERLANLEPSPSIEAAREDTFPVWMGTLLADKRFDLSVRTILNAMALNPDVSPSTLRRPRNPNAFHNAFPSQEELRFAEQKWGGRLPAQEDGEERFVQTLLGLSQDIFNGLLRRTFPHAGEPLEVFIGNLDILFEREAFTESDFRMVRLVPREERVDAEPVAAEPTPTVAPSQTLQERLAERFPNIPRFDPNNRQNRRRQRR